jgi:DNA invertase Pin-like site-specific DNA recombinase
LKNLTNVAAKGFIAYYRVSTDRQGKSGLGLDAQRQAVRQFIANRGSKITPPEFVEVESGKNDARPELAEAIERCRLTGAILVVAKLDRLSRNAVFLLTLRDSGVDFVAVDMPEANTLTVGIMAVMAQHEREAISARTRAALAASKARGRRLGGLRGNAPDVRQYQPSAVQAIKAKADEAASRRRPIVAAYLAETGSMNAAAKKLNEEGIKTPRDGTWTATAVRRLLAR